MTLPFVFTCVIAKKNCFVSTLSRNGKDLPACGFATFSFELSIHPQTLLPYLGAGIFVTTIVVGAVAFLKPFVLTQRPFLRDVIFYTVAVYWTFYLLWKGSIDIGNAAGSFVDSLTSAPAHMRIELRVEQRTDTLFSYRSC